MTYKYTKIKLPDGTTRDEHRLIMEKFLGRPLLRSEDVHHKNGNGKDNRLENLIVRSRKDHMSHHIYKRDTRLLTDEEAKIVKYADLPRKLLAEMFGVTLKCVGKIRRGVTYKEI
jgi:hypothetical protein